MTNEFWHYDHGFYKVYTDVTQVKNQLVKASFTLANRYFGDGVNGYDFLIPTERLKEAQRLVKKAEKEVEGQNRD